jgi:hypothetical protein
MQLNLRLKQNTGIRVLIFFCILLLFVICYRLKINKVHYLDEFFSLIVFSSAYYLTPCIRVDRRNLVSPKNLMLLIFFVRLVICPITIFISGYQRWVLPFVPTSVEVYKAYFITFLAFFSFVIGWDLYKDKRTVEEKFPVDHFRFRNNAVIAALLFATLLFVIFIFYGSIGNYIKSHFVEDYDKFMEGRGKLIIYAIILFKFGIPFLGIIIGLYALDRIKGGVWIKGVAAFISILLIIFLSLGPSRNNIVFPVLSFLAASIPKYFRIKFADFVLGCIVVIVIAFFFQNYRKHNPDLPVAQLNKTDKFFEFVQVYFVAPHTMTPIFRLPKETQNIHFTLHASLLESIPVLGTSFREKSGSYVYNVAYKRGLGRDQVFPTHGETFYNLGIGGVIIIFLLTGYLYRRISEFFLRKTKNDPLFRALIFYLALIFNATIFNSYSVFGQFIYYNSIFVFLIMIFRDKSLYKLENK